MRPRNLGSVPSDLDRRRMRSPGARSRDGAGFVYLVGAGPGDPDLLTCKAARLIAAAEAVVYDRLVSPEVLALVPRGVPRHFAGKRTGNHSLPQGAINRLLVRLAGEGRHVVRLKGGDPFTFGRGGEEGECLAAAGIAFEVVPGITAASGCAASAGIPLTHRDHVHACTFVTGHLRDEGMTLEWGALAVPRQTLVFYMAVRTAGIIAARLTEHGLDGATPVAIVENGTTVRQRVLTGTLAHLPDLVRRHAVRPPALIVVGEVVRLRETLGALAFEPLAELAEAAR